MCACDFNMCFTFVMSSWEGTANDSRIIMETTTNTQYQFPRPGGDKYYVVDSGYANLPGFFTPCKGERYHLRDYRGDENTPKKIEELFNYRHSSLCNIIERCFGVLKARFPILKQMSPYSVKMQKYIPIACCTVHNFIRKSGLTDRMFLEYEEEEMIVEGSDGGTSSQVPERNISQASHDQMSIVRDKIADELVKSSTSS